MATRMNSGVIVSTLNAALLRWARLVYWRPPGSTGEGALCLARGRSPADATLSWDSGLICYLYGLCVGQGTDTSDSSCVHSRK
jgi:hypothetical protein